MRNTKAMISVKLIPEGGRTVVKKKQMVEKQSSIIKIAFQTIIKMIAIIKIEIKITTQK